jgi:hypothetical protein
VRTASLALLVVALGLVPGCASLSGGKEDRQVAAVLELVRAGSQAACGAITRIGGDAWTVAGKAEASALEDSIAPSSVEACARFDPALRAEASQGSVLQVKLVFGVTDERYRPEHWHVEVVAQNGLVVLAGLLGTGRTESGDCVMGVCTTEGSASVLLPEPWQVGRYKIRLVHVPTQARVDLGFELR